tara:strand:- start:250 stop:471 length:222 start_codon:yes stop_codon:yes gene_type:complete
VDDCPSDFGFADTELLLNICHMGRIRSNVGRNLSMKARAAPRGAKIAPIGNLPSKTNTPITKRNATIKNRILV